MGTYNGEDIGPIWEVLEPTMEAVASFAKAHGYGHEHVKLSPRHIELLNEGKFLGWCDGEYTTTIGFTDPV